MYIEPISRGETREGEYNNCTARALANASLMDYDDAHELLAYYGRPDRRGCKAGVFVPAYAEAGFKKLYAVGDNKQARFVANKFDCTYVEKGLTLAKFCKLNPTGRFIVVYNGHALAVVNGNIVDTFSNKANKRVTMVFSKDSQPRFN